MSEKFDIQKWIKESPKIVYETIDYHGIEICVRRLNGLEWAEAGQAGALQNATILKYGFLDPETKKPYEYNDILEMVKAAPGRSGDIAMLIAGMTVKAQNAELEALKEAEKNF